MIRDSNLGRGIYRDADGRRKLEAERRAINAKIRKAEQEERKKIYEKVGKELEQLYKADPSCGGSEKVAGICAKYFGKS